MHLTSHRAKRRLCALAAAALLLCLPPQPAQAATFQDVPKNIWYESAVYDLVNQGIVSGTTSTTFSPDKPLTRAAFVTMLCTTVLTKQEMAQYNFKGPFTDVPTSHWSNKVVNWAYENGIVSGVGKNKFNPDGQLSRQDMAVMVVNFSRAMGRKMPAATGAIRFKDQSSIRSYAANSVRVCQQAGVIGGYQDGTFGPLKTASRAEAASLYSRFLKKCPEGPYKIIRKRINGVAVSAVEFDPHTLSPGLIMGQNKVTGREGPGSLVSRSGAKIAVNAAFFYMDSYIPIGTLISGGKALTTDNLFAPAKAAFVINSSGDCSVENFSTWFSATMSHVDGSPNATVEKVVVNQRPMTESDAARVVFTRDWGGTLGFKAKDALVVDAYGFITQVAHDRDVEIPYQGFVIAQRSRRAAQDEFFDNAHTGDVVELSHTYTGSRVEDIQVSVGVGPQIVKNGAPYGNAGTFAAEGFKDPGITVYDARRMCLGVKADGRVVILTGYTNLSRLSQIMVGLGCQEAVNCDGGGSANLYVDGQWLCGPQSRLLNHMLYFK